MELKPCGTLSAYARHIRKREVPCQPCKDANAARRRDYYSKNKKVIYERNRAWAKKNRDKIRPAVRRNVAKRKTLKLQGNYEKYTEQQVFDAYGYLCYLCHGEIDFDAPRGSCGENWEMALHFDHVIPLSKGGSDSLENIRPSHAICNMKKGSRLSDA